MPTLWLLPELRQRYIFSLKKRIKNKRALNAPTLKVQKPDFYLIFRTEQPK